MLLSATPTGDAPIQEAATPEQAIEVSAFDGLMPEDGATADSLGPGAPTGESDLLAGLDAEELEDLAENEPRRGVAGLADASGISVDVIPGGPWNFAGPTNLVDGENVLGITTGGVQIGAVTSLALSPHGHATNDESYLYAGAVNGGVWRTLYSVDPDGIDGASLPTLQPIRWRQVLGPSLPQSISHLRVELADPYGRGRLDNIRVVAATGKLSSSAAVSRDAIGVLTSIDGGDRWELSAADSGKWNGLNVVGTLGLRDSAGSRSAVIAAMGPYFNGNFRYDNNTRTLAEIDSYRSFRPYMGIWASFSDQSGTGFVQLPHQIPVVGLGNDVRITDIIASPSDSTSFYVAITGSAGWRIFQGTIDWSSHDIPVWVDLTVSSPALSGGPSSSMASFTNLQAQNIRLAVENYYSADRLFVARVQDEPLTPPPDPQSQTDPTDVFEWTETSSWNYRGRIQDISGVGLHPGGQNKLHFSFAVSSTVPGALVAGGDRHTESPYYGRLYYAHPNSSTWVPIVGVGAQDTAPHADSRDLLFDPLGNFIEADDGGVYRLRGPILANHGVGPPAVRWEAINTDLGITEAYEVARDPSSGKIYVGAQDNGVLYSEGARWKSLIGGDGTNVEAYRQGSGAVVYAVGNTLESFYLRLPGDPELTWWSGPGQMDSTGDPIPARLVRDITHGTMSSSWGSPTEPEAVKDTRFGEFLSASAGGFVKLAVNPDNPLVFYAAAEGTVAQGSIDSTARTITFLNKTGSFGAAGVLPERFTALATAGTTNGTDLMVYIGGVNDGIGRISTIGFGGTFRYTSDLPADAQRGTSVVTDIAIRRGHTLTAAAATSAGVFVTTNGGMSWEKVTLQAGFEKKAVFSVEWVGDALVLGTGFGVYRVLPNLAHLNQPQTALQLGYDLPSVPVTDVDYDPDANLLVISTLGRGAWTLENVRGGTQLANSVSIQGTPGRDVVRLKVVDGQIQVFSGTSTTPLTVGPISLETVSTVHYSGGGASDTLILEGVGDFIQLANGILVDQVGDGTRIIYKRPAVSLRGQLSVADTIQVRQYSTREQHGRATIVRDRGVLTFSSQQLSVEWTQGATFGVEDVDISTGLSVAMPPSESFQNAIQGISESDRNLLPRSSQTTHPLALHFEQVLLWNWLTLRDPILDPLPLSRSNRPSLGTGLSFSQFGLIERVLASSPGGFGPWDTQASLGGLDELAVAIQRANPGGNMAVVDTLPDGELLRMRIAGSLEVQLPVKLVAGRLNLDLEGSFPFRADVEVQMAFGFDGEGFYIANGTGLEWAIRFRNLRFAADIDSVPTFSARGSLGWLDLSMEDIAVEIADSISLEYQLSNLSEVPRLRLTDLENALGSWTVVRSGPPATSEIVVTGQLGVSLPCSDPTAGDLGTVPVRLDWANMDDPDDVRISFLGDSPWAPLLQAAYQVDFDRIVRQVQGALGSFQSQAEEILDADFLDAGFANRVLGEFEAGLLRIQKTFGGGMKSVTIESHPELLPEGVIGLIQLDHDFTFNLALDSETPVSITVRAERTRDNRSGIDFIDDLGVAVSESPLGNRVFVMGSYGFVRFYARAGEADRIQLSVSAEHEARLRELGLTNHEVSVATPATRTLNGLLALLSTTIDLSDDLTVSFRLTPCYSVAERQLTLGIQATLGYAHTLDGLEGMWSGLLGRAGTFAGLSIVNGELTLTASATLNLRLGFDFKPAENPELFTSSGIPPPSSGSLTRPADFVVRLNDSTDVRVHLDASADRESRLDGLVDALNRAFVTPLPASFFPSGRLRNLSDFIRVSRSGDRLRITAQSDTADRDLDGNGAASGVVVRSIGVLAPDDSPIVTEVGFSNQFVARAEPKGLFIDDLTVTANGELHGSIERITGRFGPVAFEVTDALAGGSIGVSFRLRPGTQVYVSDLLNGRVSAAFEGGYDPAAGETDRRYLSGSLYLDLPITRLSPGFLFGRAPGATTFGSFAIYIPDITDFHYNAEPYDTISNPRGLFIFLPDIALADLSCLTVAGIARELGAFARELSVTRSFSFLHERLPGINVSIGEILDYSGRIATVVEGLLVGDDSTLSRLNEILREVLRLPESAASPLSYARAAWTGETQGGQYVVGTEGGTLNPEGANNAMRLSLTGSTTGPVRLWLDADATATEVILAQSRSTRSSLVRRRNEAGREIVEVRQETASVVRVTYNPRSVSAQTLHESLDRLAGGWLRADLTPERPGEPVGSNSGLGLVPLSTLRLDLNYADSVTEVAPFNFDLAALATMVDASSTVGQILQTLSSFVQSEAMGVIRLSAGYDVRLVVGLDISDPCAPAFFVGDQSQVALHAAVRAEDLNLSFSILGLGIRVRGGSLIIDGDGDVAVGGSDPDAQFLLSLRPNADGGGRLELGEVARHLQVSVTAGVGLTLPLYASVGGLPLVGSEGDANRDGVPDNALSLRVPDLQRFFSPTVQAAESGGRHQLSYVFPGSNNDIRISSPTDFSVRIVDRRPEPGGGSPLVTTSREVVGGRTELTLSVISEQARASDLIGTLRTDLGAGFTVEKSEAEDTGTVTAPLVLFLPDLRLVLPTIDICRALRSTPALVDGLDSLLGGLQAALRDAFGSREIPLLGNNLGRVAQSIQAFRTGLLASIREALRTVGGGDPIPLLQEAIFNTLGPGGLGLLVDPDLTNSPIGSKGEDDRHRIPLALGAATDVSIVSDPGCSSLLFKLRLRANARVIDTTGNPLHIDLGVDALGLELTGNVVVEAGFDLLLEFGFSVREGVFLVTDSVNSAGVVTPRPELYVGVTARLPRGELEGRLFLLQLTATDNGSQVDVGGLIDLKDPIPSSGIPHLTLNDLSAPGVRFGNIVDASDLRVGADVRARLTLSFGGNAAFPELESEFEMRWNWRFSNGPPSLPTVRFNNIRVNMRSVLSGVLGPILEEIRQVTRPLDPFLQFFVTRLPILSDLAGETVTPLSLIGALSSSSAADTVRDVIEVLAAIESLIGSSEAATGVWFDLGNIVLTPNADGVFVSNAPRTDPDDPLSPQALERLKGSSDSTAVREALQKIANKARLRMPFLNLDELSRLLMGKPVRFVELTLPAIDIDIEYEEGFPVFGPLVASLGGAFRFKSRLAFGYDSRGIADVISDTTHDPGFLLNGFYFSDVDDRGRDVPEFSVGAAIQASASLNLIAVRAGVRGGIEANADANLHDPDGDGLVHLDELLSNAKMDWRCIFDFEGQLKAFFAAFLKVGFGPFSFTKTHRLAEVTLLTFGESCPDPVLAEFRPESAPGVLTLNMGPYAAQRRAIDIEDGDEVFVVESLGRTGELETVRVKWHGIQQDFAGVRRIQANGGAGRDTIDARGVLSVVEFDGGVGDDTLYAGLGDGNHLVGGEGEDRLFGGPRADTLEGGGGADFLQAGPTDSVAEALATPDSMAQDTNTLLGGTGADRILGGSGVDRISGGDGADELSGGGGDDVVDGGGGSDLIHGEQGNDSLIGGDGNDQLFGGIGQDRALGGDGDDLLEGEEDDDVLIGDMADVTRLAATPTVDAPYVVENLFGRGNDVLVGGGGADAIFGGDGDDQLFGGWLDRGTEFDPDRPDTGDFLDGGSGDDLIYADDAAGGPSQGSSGAGIQGIVWRDDRPLGAPDGIRQPEEQTLAGIEVRLLDDRGRRLAETHTDADGAYTFRALPEGIYKIEFQRLEGATFTRSRAGVPDLDSDADASTGTTQPIHLAERDRPMHIDAGLVLSETFVTIADVVVREGAPGSRSPAVLTVGLSAPSSEVVTVRFATEADVRDPAFPERRLAKANVDYLSQSGVVTFRPGEVEQQVEILVAGDSIHEASESFLVVMRDARQARIAQESSRVVILDDDPIPTVSIDDADALESAGVMDFRIRLSNPSFEPVKVLWAASDWTTALGKLVPESAKGATTFADVSETDYFQGPLQAVVFEPGQVEMTVSVSINNDSYYELDERFVVRLIEFTHSAASPAENDFGEARLGDAEAIGLIRNSALRADASVAYDDLPPSLSLGLPAAGASSVTEGDAGLRAIRAVLKATGRSAVPIEVTVSTAPGRAVEDADFENLADYLYDSRVEVIPRVDEMFDLDLTFFVKGDARVEGPEEFFVNVLAATSARIVNNHVALSIADDDTVAVDHGPWAISFNWPSYVARESDGFVELKVVRVEASSAATAVVWTSGVTAGFGLDYTSDFDLASATPRTLVRFAPGETEKTLRIQLMEDSIPESGEMIRVFVRNPAGGPVRGQYTDTTVTIVDDDAGPSLILADAVASEGGDLAFQVRLNERSTQEIALRYRLVSQSATLGSDFGAAGILTGELRFPLGAGGMTELSAVIPVPALPDEFSEPSETFLVVIEEVIHGTVVLDDCVAVGTIEDDDPVLVAGRVYQDANANGRYDPGERGLGGVAVGVVDRTGRTDLITDFAGFYQARLRLGSVQIRVDESTIPDGLRSEQSEVEMELTRADRQLPWIGYEAVPTAAVDPETTVALPSTNPDTAFGGAGNDRIDGGGGDDLLIGGHWLGAALMCEGVAYSAPLRRIIPVGAPTKWELDASALPPTGSISGNIFVDRNRNGRNDAGEEVAALPRVPVTLFNSQFQILDTTLSAANGVYRFEGLPSGLYHVQIIPPVGYDLIAPNAAGTSDSADSDFDVGTALNTDPLNVATATRDFHNVDAGMTKLPEPRNGPSPVSFDYPVYVARELAGQAEIALARLPGDPASLVAFFTSDGSARSPEDYQPARTLVRFGGLEISKNVQVVILPDSDNAEALQTVLLHLRTPAGGPATGNRSTALLIIVDDPCPDDDTIQGGDGADTILGDAGYLAADGLIYVVGGGDDRLFGGRGMDELHGQAGNDFVDGGGGDDTLEGGNNDDTYAFANHWGVDTVVELADHGSDTVDFSEATIDGLLFTVAGEVNVGAGADRVSHRGEAIETLIGGSGSDVFEVQPSVVTALTVDARGGNLDVLRFDARGLSAELDGERITAVGRQPVRYLNFERVTLLNTPAASAGERVALSPWATQSFEAAAPRFSSDFGFHLVNGLSRPLDHHQLQVAAWLSGSRLGSRFESPWLHLEPTRPPLRRLHFSPALGFRILDSASPYEWS